ncbi:hypothetical protein [Thalassorhabdomicrobium marinisediminis]|uniref:hypothetical protein n=1 Tax=Thalassorhabdomicrobium marinisediminis TaxID=2170577 RepID=UPI002490D00E|nr:hypothetical protein [Thalassorhabdomicrobium marinisediminis]
MTKLIIHIGAHKTGTTAVQKCFDENRKALQSLGVTYPRTNWFHHSQHRLAFALKGMRDPAARDFPDIERETDALNAAIELAGTPQVMISSEEFFSCKPDQIARFEAALHVDDIEVVATVRRPDTLLVSMYNQKAKQPNNGFKRLIQHFVDAPRTLDPDMRSWDCISNWRSAMTSNLTLLQYENGPAIEQVLGVLGLPADALPPFDRVNESVPGAVVEVMRMGKAMDLSEPVQQKLFWLANHLLQDRPPYYLKPTDRKKVIETFEAENNELFGAFGLENPYTVASYTPDPDEKQRQNMAFRDLMVILADVLENDAP